MSFVTRHRLGASDWEICVLLPRFELEQHMQSRAVDVSWPQTRNGLLAALPASEFKRLRPSLQHVDLPLREVISAAGNVITHAYFVEDGVVSVVQPLADGVAVEVGLIGREGFVGVPLVLGSRTSPAEANVQLKASALRITAKALREAMQRNKTLNSLLLCFTHAFHIQVTQTAACNGRHDLQQRLARWLLAARDRSDSDQLPLSHEFLAMMLGRRRAGVTVALGSMKRAGFIKNHRGQIQIVDRRGLEKVACECYRLIRDEYRRMLP
jgi:CRP-like cAMP-binding protein